MTIPVKHYQLRTILKKLESFLEPEPEPESEAIDPAAIVSPQDPNPREREDAKDPPTPTGSASNSIFCLLAFFNKKLVVIVGCELEKSSFNNCPNLVEP